MPQSIKNLSRVSEGTKVIIESISGRGAFRRHLLELGFISGTHVQCLSVNKILDSMTFRIRGAKICLRIDDAALIKIF